MKRFLALMLVALLLIGCVPTAAFAKKNTQMNKDVPVWTEDTVRQYALDYVSGKSMSRLWGYYDLQIRRYMPMATYESILTDLEWMTGAFVGLGSYRSFDELNLKSKTHVLHFCMEKQDLDLYFTHKDKENDWEIMAIEFVPAEKELISNNGDMLVGDKKDESLAPVTYIEAELTIGTEPYRLGATLTTPTDANAENPIPACVLVHDTGALDRNHTLGQTTMFADLAHELAEMGVASIRYDKRSFTYGEAPEATVYEEVVQDAILAGKELAKNPLVDRTRMVVMGLGLGASLAPRIAFQAEGLFTGLVMIGGTPQTQLELELAKHGAELEAMDAEARKTLKAQAGKLADMKESKARELSFFGKSGYYYWEMEQFDPISLIKKMKLPTYIVQGKKDPIVSDKEGRLAYSEAIGDGISFVSFKSFRGLNHLLMNDLSANESGAPEYDIATSVDIQAGRNLAQWVLAMNTANE
ncbi:MAG: hypothetical protein RR379_00150 [Clostridia bacterium]